MIRSVKKVQNHKFLDLINNRRISYRRSCQKGATKVDVVCMLLIKFNDTDELNDRRKVYKAKKVAPFRGNVN
jgi:hypothetical protein